MADLRFEWTPRKAAANLVKHQVAFEEAETVFSDDAALLIADPEHSDDEDRFVLLGLSAKLRVLLVVHCYHERDEVVTIISARKADRVERRQYVTRNL